MEEYGSAAVGVGKISLRKMTFLLDHICESSAGKPYHLFGFARRGSAVLDYGAGTLGIPENGFFYLPAGLRYRNRWRGEPDVEYYILSFWGDAPDMAPALIPPLSVPSVLKDLERLGRLLSGDPRDRFAAFSLFYSLMDRAAPYLAPDPSRRRSRAVEDAVGFIRDNAATDFSLEDLARAVCLSVSRISHLFREETGASVTEYKNEVRTERAAALLRNGASVGEAARAVGFDSDIYFGRIFKRIMGVTPGEYRKSFS